MPAQAEIKAVITAQDNASSTIQGFANNVENVASSAAKAIGNVSWDVFKTGAIVATTAVVALGVKGLSSANQLQSLQLSMNGLTHSMTLGAQAMAGAYAYAQKAPFQLPEVAGTTKTLIAYGMSAQQAVGSLETLGNVSITTGIPIQSLGNIFGQVSAQGKLMLQDIRQLTENGVAILPALEKEFGKTAQQVQDMATAGSISFDQFNKAMQSLVDPTILDQLNNTMPRQIDRLKGSVRVLSNAFVGVGVDATNGFTMASTGIAQAATNLVKVVANTLRSPELTNAAANLGTAIVPLINAISTAIVPLANGIATLTNWFVNLGSSSLPILGLVLAAISGVAGEIPVIGSAIAGISPLTGLLVGLFAMIVAKSPQLQQAFGQAFATIGQVLGQLQPVFSQIGTVFVQLVTTIGNALAPVVGVLAQAFGQVLAIIMPIIPVLLSALVPAIGAVVGAFGQIITALAPLLPILAQIFVNIIQSVVIPMIPIVTQIITILASAFSQILTALMPVVPVLGQIFVQILQQIVLPLLPLIVQLVQLFANVITMVFAAIAPLLPQLLGLVSVLITALAPILPQLVNLFIQLVVALLPLIPPLLQLITLVLPILISLLTVQINIWQTLVTILISIVIGAIHIVIDAIKLWVDILVHVIDFINRLWNIASVQFNNLKNAVGNSVGGVISFLQGLPGKIQGAFGDAGNMLLGIGGRIIDGLVQGIKNGFAKVKSTLGDLTNKLKDWKGPESVDRVLLVDNAKTIMTGFVTGLEGQYDTVKKSLGGLTSDLTMAVTPTVPVTNSIAAAVPQYIPAQQPTSSQPKSEQTINITIQAGAFMGTQMDARKYAQMIMDAYNDAQSAKGVSA